MAVYEVTLPSGEVYEVESERELTAEQVQGFLQEGPQESFLKNTFDVAAEAAAGANRTITSIPDAIPNAVNDVLQMSGSDRRMPTIRGNMPGIEGGYMEPGMAREATQAFGETVLPGAMAVTQVPRNLAKAGPAAAEFMGFGSARAPVGAQLNPTSTPTPPPAGTKPGPETARELALLRNSPDQARVGFVLDDAGRAAPDPSQTRAVSAGIDRGTVGLVASANQKERQNMLRMLDVLEEGKGNYVLRDTTRPSVVLGDSLAERVNVVAQANRQAGQKIDDIVVNKLPQMPLSQQHLNDLYEGPIMGFMQRLNRRGVKMARNADGEIDVLYEGSHFDEIPEAQNIINKVVRYLRKRTPETAQDVHRLKEWIDELGEVGKQQTGLKSKAIGALYETRKGVNDFLRELSPEYARVNDVYSESIGALKELDRILGTNTDVWNASPESLARISRRILSNAQSREAVRDVLYQMDELGTKYGGEFGDDITKQASFLNELDKMFGASAQRSLMGENQKAMERTMRVARDGNRGAVDTMFDMAREKFGKSPDEQEREMLAELRRLIASGSSP